MEQRPNNIPNIKPKQKLYVTKQQQPYKYTTNNQKQYQNFRKCKPVVKVTQSLTKQAKRQRQTANLIIKIKQYCFAAQENPSAGAIECINSTPRQILPLLACLVANYKLVTLEDVHVLSLLWNNDAWIKNIAELFPNPIEGGLTKKFFTASKKTLARIKRMIKINNREKLVDNSNFLQGYLATLVAE